MCLSFVGKDRLFRFATSSDGKRWSKPQILSPFFYTFSAAGAPDGSVWAIGKTYSTRWMRRRKPIQMELHEEETVAQP